MNSDTATLPMVTVLVPTYRSGGSLHFALQSIRLQSFVNYEVIVIGDGDPEPSGEIVRSMEDSRFQYVALERNSGTSAAPNQRGTQLAKGLWIAYLGQDDLWLPWHLEQLVAAASAGDVDFLYSMVFTFGPEGLRGIRGARPASYDEIRTDWFAPPSGWMHRAELGKRSGGWRSDSAAMFRPVDVDFLMRAIDSGATLRQCPRPSVLKFPSPWFNAYGDRPIRPQAGYLDLIRERPEQLERNLLTDAAGLSAKHWHLLQHGAPTDVAVRLIHAVFDHWLRRTSNTPGLRWLWRAYYRRQRRKGQKSRGLE